MNKNIFRKAMTVAASAAMVGMTIGAAAAASYPAGFTSNTAVVVGSGAAASDSVAAGLVLTGLNSAAGTQTNLAGASGVTEDEIPLGGTILVNKLVTGTFKDTKIGSLLDAKLRWDDGGPSGSDDYDYHEELVINSGTMEVRTTLQDEDYKEHVALTNDFGFEYRYVFEDAFNTSGVGSTDAETLYLTILGKTYEIEAMTATSITVVTSEELALSVGGSYTTPDGKTFTVGDIFTGQIQINGEFITDGQSKKIDGKKIKVQSIGYHSNSPELSTVILKIGDDISKTYSNDEEYVGEDEDDPLWVWNVVTANETNGYIGIKYNQKELQAKHNVVYAGGSYILPENFGAVQFDGLTSNIDYQDFTVSFDDNYDLYTATQTSGGANISNGFVMIIEANDKSIRDAMITTTSKETNKMVLRWAPTGSEIGLESASVNGSLEIYYDDINGDIAEGDKIRFVQSYISDVTGNAGGITDVNFANITVGDTIVKITATVATGGLTLTFTDTGAGQAIVATVGGVQLTDAVGDLKWLGAYVESTEKGIALAGDVAIGGTNVGTYDNDLMTTNGLIVAIPDDNADNDEILISIPDDRVYALVSVIAGGTATTSDSGIMSITDSQISSASGKNLIVVGGSAINTVAADLLGGAFSEGAFTAATGIGQGQFLIKAFDRGSNVALLIAGYEAADTSKAVTYLLNNNVDVAVGITTKKTSSSFSDVV